jgi:Putative collagen-binding domain of a collagenase
MACIRAGDYVAVYSTQGKSIRLYIDRLGKKTELWDTWWYDLRLGILEKCLPENREGIFAFKPPSSGYGQDWLLVLRRGARVNMDEYAK